MLDGMCAKSVPGNDLTIYGMPILGNDLCQKMSGAEDHIHTGIQSLYFRVLLLPSSSLLLQTEGPLAVKVH